MKKIKQKCKTPGHKSINCEWRSKIKENKNGKVVRKPNMWHITNHIELIIEVHRELNQENKPRRHYVPAQTLSI